VCLKAADATSCVDAFNIFVINEQTGIATNLDGIWGMSSGRKTITGQTGPLLMDALKTANKVSAKIFGFGLKIAATGTSFLDFGAINNAAMRNSATELFYIPATVDYWWSNNMNGIKFGAGQNLTNAFKLNVVTPAFSDSGSTCTYIPKVYYNTIMTEILKKATSYTYHSTWGYLVPCSDSAKLDPIQFLYNDVWLEIQPADYLLDVGVTSGQTCSLCMYESAVTVESKNYWLLGNNFMRGFYSIYDMDNAQFGFAPLVGSTKTAPGKADVYGGAPTTNLAENSKSPWSSGGNSDNKDNKKKKSSFPWWGWVIIGCSIAVVVIVVIVIIVECTGESEEE
jgi:hypothetical protein